jgi:tetratricopeptide (TPR) repeat protein
MKHILILLFSLAFIFNGFGQTAADYLRSGNSKYELEDYRGAISDFTKAIEIRPQFAAAYNNRGNSKADLGDNRGAIVDYTKGIEFDPQYADAYYNRGISMIKLDQLDSGCLDFSKAGELGYPNAYEAIRLKCN